MQSAHEAGPRRPSAFAAAFLSLLFPGLGHAYLGAHRRALGYAAPPILIGALVAGVGIRLDVFELAGLAVQSWFIATVFVVNLVALAYRAAAIVDAWRIGRWLQSGEAARGPRGVRRAVTAPVAAAGLAAVLIVMSVAHVAVARYDLLLAGTTACIFDPRRPAATRPGPPLRMGREGRRTRRGRPLRQVPSGRPSRRSAFRPGTGRSASTSCSSAPTSRAAATTRTP